MSQLLQSAASNVLRVTFRRTALGRVEPFVLIEEAATNLLLRSQELDNASWTTAGTLTITANSTVAPDGTTTADTLDDTSAAATSGRTQAVTVANDSVTRVASAFIAATRATPTVFPALTLAYSGGTGVTAVLTLNPATGAFVTANGVGVVERIGDFWRVSLAAANNSSGNTTATVGLYPAYASTLSTTAAVAATGAAVFWGAQLEANTFASSYIATTTTTVARANDLYATPISGATTRLQALTWYVRGVLTAPLTQWADAIYPWRYGNDAAGLIVAFGKSGGNTLSAFYQWAGAVHSQAFAVVGALAADTVIEALVTLAPTGQITLSVSANGGSPVTGSGAVPAGYVASNVAQEIAFSGQGEPFLWSHMIVMPGVRTLADARGAAGVA